MQIYQTKKEKILKVIQIVYDIISALFIVFVSISLAIGSNKGEKGVKNDNTPTIQEVISREKRLNDDLTMNGWAFYSIKTHSDYQRWVYNGTSGLNNYFTINTTSGTLQYNAVYTFSFIQLESNMNTFNSILMTFASPQNNYIVVSKIQLLYVSDDGTWSNYSTLYDVNGPVVHSDYIIGVGDLINSSSGFLIESYSGAVIDYYFNRLAISSILEDVYTFDVNKFNPNFWLSLNVNNYNIITNYGTYTATLHLPLLFVSNGYLFDEIKVVYNYTYGVYYKGANNYTKIEYTDMAHITFDYMQYRYYGTSTYITACAVPTQSSETFVSSNNQQLTRNYKMTAVSDYRWANEGYKTLSIVSGLDGIAYEGDPSIYDDPILNLTMRDILNYRGEFVISDVNSGYYGDMFGLLSSAFGSVANIMAIQLLPNITIGLLLFLPLVITIIIVIIRLVKK